MKDDKTPKQNLLEHLSDLPHLGFSRRPAATPEEGSDRTVLWGVKSLREVVQEADRRFGTALKKSTKSGLE
jgi:hypothetical protein